MDYMARARAGVRAEGIRRAERAEQRGCGRGGECLRPRNPIDVAQYEGELVSKDVTVTATITKDGSSSERTMVITLQKVEFQDPDGLIEGRWIITALE